MVVGESFAIIDLIFVVLELLEPKGQLIRESFNISSFNSRTVVPIGC